MIRKACEIETVIINKNILYLPDLTDLFINKISNGNDMVIDTHFNVKWFGKSCWVINVSNNATYLKLSQEPSNDSRLTTQAHKEWAIQK